MIDGILHLTHLGVSFQGTGHLIGERQYFVRFAGCSIKRCPIRNDCDEFTSFGPHSGFDASVEDVIDRALDAVGPGGWLHVTGGEPTEQPENLAKLVQLAHRERLRVQIQTAGLTALNSPLDWITVSPKVPARKLQQRSGQELVLVYDGQTVEEMREYQEGTSFCHYYLQPKWIDAPRGEALNNEETVRAAHSLDGEWKLTLQAHKYLGIY